MSCTQGDVMTDNVDANVDDSNSDGVKSPEGSPEPKTKADPVDKEVVDKYVEERVKEQVKEFKNKVDSAFEQRDLALKKVQEFEKKEREAEVKRLKEEGKEREAYEMQLAEVRARAEALEKQNTELTRDVEVRGILSNYTFRNDKASDMAYRDVVGQLVRDENNKWVHRSGIPIKDFIKQFADHEDNAFLFKARVSTGGGGSGPVKTGDTSGGKKSLFKMSQEEVIKLAQEGKLP
jgi:DNA repair exonuclease SbcCD ATPase subunit